MACKAKVIQWNCQSLKNKKHELIQLINYQEPFLVCLQETWLRQESMFKIPGYSCLREDRPDGYGGVAILIKNSYTFSHLSLPSHSNDLSVVAAVVNNICYVSLYFSRPNIDILNEINMIFGYLPKPFVCLGDFNCHHQLWGCMSNNYYGEQLLDLLSSHNLCILNNGMPTRFARTPSVPDLSICTPDLASCLSWQPLGSTYGSDHFPITICLPYPKPPCEKKQPRVKHKLTNADWDSFKRIVENKVTDMPEISQTNTSKCSDLLAKLLIEAANEVFPLKTCGSSKIPSPPWWDKECTNAIKERKKANKLYCSNMSDENFDNYLQTANNTKELLRKKKFDGWRSFCTSICPNTNPSIVWQNIRRFRSAFTDSTHSKMSSALAEQVMDRLGPPSVSEQLVLDTCSIYNNNFSNEIDLNGPFSMYELRGVLSYVKDSAPGEDSIPYSFLSNLDSKSLNYYLSLINSIMFSGNVPRSWRTQSLVLLLKPKSLVMIHYHIDQ